MVDFIYYGLMALGIYGAQQQLIKFFKGWRASSEDIAKRCDDLLHAAQHNAREADAWRLQNHHLAKDVEDLKAQLNQAMDVINRLRHEKLVMVCSSPEFQNSRGDA